MRLRCYLFGCWCDQNSSCPKCGAALYDADFIQKGKLDWVHRLRFIVADNVALVHRRCDVCGKRIWFTRWSPCCSEDCYDKYIPF